MARLRSELKMGHYPTPLNIIKHLRKTFRFEPAAKIYDPCCGDGSALAALAPSTTITYGVELDYERFSSASKKLDVVLNCDSVNEVHLKGNFDLLFLNPPYDYDIREGDEKVTRTETRFLKKHLPAVRKNGWLVLIIPIYSLQWMYKLLSQRVEEPRVFLFPEEDFLYKQIVVIGKVVSGEGNNKHFDRLRKNMSFLESIIKRARDDYGSLKNFIPTTEEINEIFTVEAKAAVSIFESLHIDPEEALVSVKKSSLYNLLDKIDSQFNPHSRGAITPLSNLSEGHLAMLLASGVMNDRIENLVLKGRVNSYQKTTDEGDKRRSIKQYQVIINAFDLETGELVKIA